MFLIIKLGLRGVFIFLLLRSFIHRENKRKRLYTVNDPLRPVTSEGTKWEEYGGYANIVIFSFVGYFRTFFFVQG